MPRSKITLHPKAGLVAVVTSLNDVPIRLPEERWAHILEHHDELVDLLDQVLITVAEPDMVFTSPRDVKENLVAVKSFNELSNFGLAECLAVHYRETSSKDGFILTVFPISIERMRRRYKEWQRLK